MSSLCVTICVAAAMLIDTPVANDGVTERHRKVVNEVFSQVVEVTEKPDGWDQWPPILQLRDNPVPNASAGSKQNTRKKIPVITVNRGMVEMTEFEPDVLALTICHEFVHLLRVHSHKHQMHHKRLGSLGAATAMMAVIREAEFEADAEGAKLALKAGFTQKGIRKNMLLWLESGKVPTISPFDALNHDHPAWEQRAAHMEQGTPFEILWYSMARFRNGVRFLGAEDYDHAADCFRRVLEQFPDCFEAWSNLGYAYLMKHLDGLTEDEIKTHEIGHVVAGCFYREPLTLKLLCECEQAELSDREPTPIVLGGSPLEKAQVAFEKAIAHKEHAPHELDLVLLDINLAIADLVQPQGSGTQQAAKRFAQIREKLASSQKFATDPIARAAAWINVGSGQAMDDEIMRKALKQLRQYERKVATLPQSIRTLEAALHFTQATQLADSDDQENKKAAKEKFELYLNTMLPTDAWWSIAFADYEALAQHLGQTAKSKDEFYKLTVNDWRPVSSLIVGDNRLVGVSQSSAVAQSVLGEPDRTSMVIEGESIRRHYYDDLGISILACREVLAIFLDSEKAPAIALHRPGIGNASETLRVGMSRKKLESLIGDEWNVEYTNIDDLDTIYHLYRRTGIAARFEKDKVIGLAIVVVPSKK